MLSQLGGAVITSSGPAFSLDSRTGNSRQDETHPDTLTAPALPTLTVEAEVLPRILCPPQAFFFLFSFFEGTLVIKTFERTKEAALLVLGVSKTGCT